MKKYTKTAVLTCTVLIFTLVLGACGNAKQSANAANPSGNASASAQEQTNAGNANASAEPSAGATHTYETEKGPVVIPVHPERVVMAVQDFVGDALVLGVTPVGAAGWVFDTPYYKDQLQSTENVGDNVTVNFEEIASLNPDLIITYQDNAYEDLSKIAPTVYIPWGKYNFRDRLVEMGKILGKEQEAESWLAAFDQKVAAKKSELADIIANDEKVAIIELTDKEMFLYGKSYGRGGDILYNELGLHAPAKVEEVAFKEGWAKISLEAVPEYLNEADFIMLGVRDAAVGTAGDAEARKAQLTKSPLWTSLPAVKAGNVFEYDVQDYYFTDPLALDKQLDELTEKLASK